MIAAAGVAMLREIANQAADVFCGLPHFNGFAMLHTKKIEQGQFYRIGDTTAWPRSLKTQNRSNPAAANGRVRRIGMDAGGPACISPGCSSRWRTGCMTSGFPNPTGRMAIMVTVRRARTG